MTAAPPPVRTLVIFGATGDLTSRHLLPAVARLHQAGRLPEGLAILALGRRAMDSAAFRRQVRQDLQTHARGVALSSQEAVAAALEYRRAEVTDPPQLAAALGPRREPLVAYLALPPALFAPVIEALSRVGLPAGCRVVVEKPFGEDLASAQDLNRLLHRLFPETAIFRIDHFLGKQTVQNVLGLRFANRVFEPLWNRGHIERVEITWDETLTVEGRVAFYERAGALRDVVQNHLLQLLALVAMEPPLTLGEYDLRHYKVDALRAVRRLTPDEVARGTRRARYGAGRIGDREVPAYIHEPGVDPDRGTETFAEITLFIDNWRWAGVPFALRSGKALGRDRREIAVHFQPVPHLAFAGAMSPQRNVLRLQLDPDRVALTVNINSAGELFDVESVDLETQLAPQELPAYGRLLLDVFEGDPTLSIRADEAEESWRIIEPILDAWAQGRVPLQEYPAGSAGPAPPSAGAGPRQGRPPRQRPAR